MALDGLSDQQTQNSVKIGQASYRRQSESFSQLEVATFEGRACPGANNRTTLLQL
jgi:hypothetical protein